jgi:hypothetical protein
VQIDDPPLCFCSLNKGSEIRSGHKEGIVILTDAPKSLWLADVDEGCRTPKHILRQLAVPFLHGLVLNVPVLLRVSRRIQVGWLALRW